MSDLGQNCNDACDGIQKKCTPVAKGHLFTVDAFVARFKCALTCNVQQLTNTEAGFSSVAAILGYTCERFTTSVHKTLIFNLEGSDDRSGTCRSAKQSSQTEDCFSPSTDQKRSMCSCCNTGMYWQLACCVLAGMQLVALLRSLIVLLLCAALLRYCGHTPTHPSIHPSIDIQLAGCRIVPRHARHERVPSWLGLGGQCSRLRISGHYTGVYIWELHEPGYHAERVLPPQ